MCQNYALHNQEIKLLSRLIEGMRNSRLEGDTCPFTEIIYSYATVESESICIYERVKACIFWGIWIVCSLNIVSIYC